MKNSIRFSFTIFSLIFFTLNSRAQQKTFEELDRGLVAIPTEKEQTFISWRLLEKDKPDIAFNVFRKNPGGEFVQINQSPLTNATSFTDTAQFNENCLYAIQEISTNKKMESPVKPWVKPYFSIPMQTPDGYQINDGSIADLDGDGQYELVIHMMGRGRDNSHNGFTDEPIYQAYKMDGTLMWSINLGLNIREGAHYTPFLVYDFDGDGKAEIAMKTSDGSKDGLGNLIGTPFTDYRNDKGHILKGPEYLTIFDGTTGKALATEPYEPARHPSKTNPTQQEMAQVWGDGRGNRSERYLGGVAFLDGKHASIIMSRGYYERVGMSAWDWDGKHLTRRWFFDSDDGSKQNYKAHGQGNHSLSIADVDKDGADEIIFGSAVIDNDGTVLHATGFGHGDALHVSDLVPENPGLEIFTIQERFDDAGMNMRDAKTGKVLWKIASVQADTTGSDKGEGPGRGVSFNIDPRYDGNECWVFGAGIRGLYTAEGELISEKTPRSCNFAIYWDGDFLREILDKTYIAKWNWEEETFDTLLEDKECRSNNGTKSTPVMSADIFGDWREEVIWRSRDNKELRIYSTTIPTDHRVVCLMQNHQYRMAIAWQNVGYNQPPHPSFYLNE